jgi:hypothetical protein
MWGFVVLLANPQVLAEKLPSDQRHNCKALHILGGNKHNIKIESVAQPFVKRLDKYNWRDSNIIMNKLIQFLNSSQAKQDFVKHLLNVKFFF